MPKLYVVLLKTIIRKWFLFLVIAIVIVSVWSYYRFNRFEPAIIMTVIALLILIASYIPGFFKSKKMVKLMKDYYRIEDKTIAKKMGRSLKKTRDKMFDLSQNQVRNKRWKFWIKKKDWLIVFLNRQYIFYHQLTIEKFIELYKKGYTDSEMLEDLKEFELSSKAEIKFITDALIKYERIGERDISVKERREKQRFKS